jgi:hypothetical protein
LVITLRIAPVALFVTVRLAPDTAAPDESFTNPVISPLVCAVTLIVALSNATKPNVRAVYNLFRIRSSYFTDFCQLE